MAVPSALYRYSLAFFTGYKYSHFSSFLSLYISFLVMTALAAHLVSGAPESINWLRLYLQYGHVAGAAGIEPAIAESKSVALPLGYAPI